MKKCRYGSKKSAFPGSTGKKAQAAVPYSRFLNREKRIVEKLDSQPRHEGMIYRCGEGWIYD